jgi:hypothetical protein
VASPFERLQRCSRCGVGVIPPDPPRICPHCQAVHVVPRFEDWPDGLAKWLVDRYLQLFFRPYQTEQARMEYLLRSCFVGEIVNGHVIPHGSSASDIYPAALAEFEKWKANRAAGEPARAVA